MYLDFIFSWLEGVMHVHTVNHVQKNIIISYILVYFPSEIIDLKVFVGRPCKSHFCNMLFF